MDSTMTSTKTLRRITRVVHGYDCIAKPCGKDGCGSRPSANHGRHCDDWHFCVSDGEVALELTVFAGNYPTSPRAPEGVELFVHASFATKREEASGEYAPHDCEWVDGGKCFLAWHSLISAAGDFWTRHHTSSTPEQGESFWRELEARWHELSALVRADRVEACPHCLGSGVRRPQ